MDRHVVIHVRQVIAEQSVQRGEMLYTSPGEIKETLAYSGAPEEEC